MCHTDVYDVQKALVGFGKTTVVQVRWLYRIGAWLRRTMPTSHWAQRRRRRWRLKRGICFFGGRDTMGAGTKKLELGALLERCQMFSKWHLKGARSSVSVSLPFFVPYGNNVASQYNHPQNETRNKRKWFNRCVILTRYKHDINSWLFLWHS